MDAPKQNVRGYSAQVYMELRHNGHVLPIAQMGPDFLEVKEPFDHPPADAEIYLRIDDLESRWRVHLDEGIGPQRRKTRVSPVQ